MSYVKREAKQKISSLCHLSCRLGHRQISTHQGFDIAVASHQVQGFILQATPHAFSLKFPHSFLSWTILLASLTSKHLFLKRSFTVSIHLPTERLPAHTLTYILFWQSYPSPSSPHGRTTLEHLHQSFHLDPSSLCITPLSIHSGPYPSSKVVDLYSPNSRPLLFP